MSRNGTMLTRFKLGHAGRENGQAVRLGERMQIGRSKPGQNFRVGLPIIRLADLRREIGGTVASLRVAVGQTPCDGRAARCGKPAIW